MSLSLFRLMIYRQDFMVTQLELIYKSFSFKILPLTRLSIFYETRSINVTPSYSHLLLQVCLLDLVILYQLLRKTDLLLVSIRTPYDVIN